VRTLEPVVSTVFLEERSRESLAMESGQQELSENASEVTAQGADLEAPQLIVGYDSADDSVSSTDDHAARPASGGEQGGYRNETANGGRASGDAETEQIANGGASDDMDEALAALEAVIAEEPAGGAMEEENENMADRHDAEKDLPDDTAADDADSAFEEAEDARDRHEQENFEHRVSRLRKRLDVRSDKERTAKVESGVLKKFKRRAIKRVEILRR
jgi:hypothetical protein